MRRKRIDSRYWLVVMALVILVIFVLLVSSLNQNKKLNVFEIFIKDSTLNVFKILSTPFTSATNNNQDSIIKLRAETESLKLELAELRKEQTSEYPSNFNKISAKIITRNIGTWYNQVTIDKGSNDGLKAGMAVMNGEGLVGITKFISKSYSDVTLVTSNQSNLIIPAEILSLNDREFGYIKGYKPESHQLVFNKINHNIDAQIGDYVTTSSISGELPRGLKIGTISKIVKDEYGIVSQFYVDPATNNQNILYVTVLAP